MDFWRWQWLTLVLLECVHKHLRGAMATPDQREVWNVRLKELNALCDRNIRYDVILEHCCVSLR